VTFTLTPEDLAFITLKNQKLAEHGTFEITIGELKATVELVKDIADDL